MSPDPNLITRHAPIERVFHWITALAVLLLLASAFLPILVHASWGTSSYLQIENRHIEAIYQTAGFVVSGIGIWLGIRGRLREVTNLSCTFCVIYLYTKFFDWWWDWMPKYLFFFILGSIAVGLLLLLKRLRGVSMRHAT